jgi:DNA polymerase-3 subunit epsilon
MANSVKTILGIDLEGMNQNLSEDGVNLKKDRVTEIGAVLWDCHFNQPIKIMSDLINEPDHLPISEEVEELTGISDNMLDLWGHPKENIPNVLKQLAQLMENADAIMAHNGGMYDKPMLTGLFERFSVPMPDKLWIDTSKHIEYPKRIQAYSMQVLEHSHGFINPYPHRAVTDVLAMFKIASQYSFNRMFQLASSPIVQLIAILDAPNWKDYKEVEEFNRVKHRVSRARFRWQPDIKKWVKEVPKILVDEGKCEFEFDFYIKEL